MNRTETRARQLQLRDIRRKLQADVVAMTSSALGGAGVSHSVRHGLMPIHPAELATDCYEQEFTLSLVEYDERILARVNAALERLDDGTFGRCEACGKPIAQARLNALPYAELCIHCAQHALL